MTRYALILTSFFIGIVGSLQAQNDADVSRYTSNYTLGTARFNAMGGAFGALGGDMTSLHVNPAGVGVYRFGEISVTPALEINSLQGRIGDNKYDEMVTKPVINSIGFVLANEIKGSPDWRSINFSVSYNRLNTFNDKLSLNDNVSSINSLNYDFLFEADGLPLGDLSNFGSGLAYDTYLIDSAGPNTYAPILPEGVDVSQSHTVERSGRLAETALTVGANYRDQLYIGGGFGFQTAEYEQTARTTETPNPGANTDLDHYTLTERLHSQGIGVNFKLGAIYRVNQYLRLGASAQTPTVFSMSDTYSSEITSYLLNPKDSYNSRSPAGYFEYRVRTPWRFMFSAAGVLGKKAIISAQYERVNFSSGELRNSGSGHADFSNANLVLNRDYTNSDIFRVGLEYRLTDSFSARGGFSYFGNPVKANEEYDIKLDRFDYSVGLGYRKASWYIDAAYRLGIYEEPYTISQASNLAVLRNQLTSVALTVGFRM